MPDSIQLVRGLYAAFAAGDVPGVLSRLAADVHWMEAEGQELAEGNPYVGPEAVLHGVFARLAEQWADFRVEITELVGGGECVVMLGRYKARHARTGKQLDAQASHMWWMRDGKVVRFQQMVDTAALERAAT